MTDQFAKRATPQARLGETGSSSLDPRAGEGEGAVLPPAGRLKGGIDYRALRRLISMADVLEVLGWRPVARHGPQLRGPCPIHKSANVQSRSLSVHLDRCIFQCFGCQKKGNQLDLYAAATGLPIFDAARMLAERLGVDPAQIEKRNS